MGRADANLRKSKIWRLSLLHYPPPPPNVQHIPAHKLTYGLGHYEVLHEVDTIKIYLDHCNDKIVFVSD